MRRPPALAPRLAMCALIAALAMGGTARRAPRTPIIEPEPLVPLVGAVPVLPPAVAGVILASHNRARASVGAPALVWDERLAQGAKLWAGELARSGRFAHAPETMRANAGENLFWGTAGAFSPQAMIDDFIAESDDFQPGTFPNVARDGQWQNVAHYTQIVWRNTRAVGCAIARGGGRDVLVCRYWPAGNVFGQRVP